MRARVLVAVPDTGYRRALAKELDRDGIEPLTCGSADAALSLARTGAVGAAIVDAVFVGEGALFGALGAAPIVFVGLADEDIVPDDAAAALPRGTEAKLAHFAVRRALELADLRARAARAESRLGAEHGQIITVSKVMRAVVAQAKRTERAPINVLITGEPGTGKELLARIALGGADAAVADLSLAGAPDAAIASVTANGIVGPLLVLHVERLGADGQARLLAAIRAGRGGRVVSTADAELRGVALEGGFDRRLYQALSTTLIEVPPLRARPDDIGMLAVHFLRASGDGERRVSHSAMRALRAHGWPENVPELRAAMMHASIVSRGDAIVPGDLPFVEKKRDRSPLAEMPYADARAEAVGAFEHAYVAALLAHTAKNYSAAARLAGMDRANFRRLVKRVESQAPRQGSKRRES